MWLHGSLVHKSSVDSMLVNSLNWQESTGTLLSSALQSFVDTSDMSHGVEQRTRSTQNRRLHGDHATGPLAGPPRETGHWPAGVLWCPVVFRRTPFTGSAASTTGCNYQDVEDRFGKSNNWSFRSAQRTSYEENNEAQLRWMRNVNSHYWLCLTEAGLLRHRSSPP